MAGMIDRLVLPGLPPIEVNLRRSRATRRMSLRVSHLDGRVTLSIPARLPLRQARAFLDEKADWVRGHLAHRPVAPEVGLGAVIPVEGQPVGILASGRRSPLLSGGTLLVAQNRDVGPQVAAWLRNLARARLAAACDRHAAALGRKFRRITLRDTRSRWGSCTSEGNLMFSWRLIMAPPAVLDYVAAHEAAHLVEMNHSPAFWSTVARLCPDYRTHRRWLRENGAALHQIRFDR
jgi:predicted metal-dependent hydrolase